MKNRSFALIVLCALALGLTAAAFAAEKKAAGKSTEAQKQSEKGSATQPASSGGVVDLNTATKEQLMTVPGITEEYANKIIEGRPYREKITLRRQNILPPDVFYAATDKITIDPKKLERLLKGKGQTKKK